MQNLIFYAVKNTIKVKPLTIVSKAFILDVYRGFGCTSACMANSFNSPLINKPGKQLHSIFEGTATSFKKSLLAS